MSARLAADRVTILCGRLYPSGRYCDTIIGKVETWGVPEARHVVYMSDAELRGGIVVRAAQAARRQRYGNTPERRGTARVMTGEWRRVPKGFPLRYPVRCPVCRLVNALDPEALDVADIPR